MKMGVFPGGGLLFLGVSLIGLGQHSFLAGDGGALGCVVVFMIVPGMLWAVGGMLGIVPRWIGPRWYREYAKKRRAEKKRAREKRKAKKRAAKEARERGLPEPEEASLAPLDAETARGIVPLRSLVEKALSRSQLSHGDTAVLRSVAEPGRYVQWLLDPAGITVEVSDPDEAESVTDSQSAVLEQLELIRSDQHAGNYFREMSRQELERGDVAEVVARLLWQVLDVRDPAGVEVEVH